MTQRSKAPVVLIAIVLAALLATVWLLLRDAGMLDSGGRPPVTTTVEPSPEPPTAAPAVAREEFETPSTAELETLSGRVIDSANNSPIPAKLRLQSAMPAFVELDPIAGEAQHSTVPEEAVIVRTIVDADGTFRLEGTRLVGYYVPEDPFLVMRDAVFVDARESSASRDVRVERAGVVKGLVRGPDGAPRSNAKVQLRSKVAIDVAFQRRPIRREFTTQSDAEGRFTIEHVPAAIPFDLAITSEEVLKQWRTIEVAAGTTLDVEVSLSAGTTLAGRVRLENGNPVGGARISATEATLRVDPNAPQRADVGEVSTTSGPDGRFVLRGVLPGRYAVHANHPDYVRATLKSVAVQDGGSVLDEDLVLTSGLRISGRVVAADDTPVAGADLGLRKSSAFAAKGLGLAPDSAEQMGGHRFTTDDDGNFASPPLSTGEYEIVAVKKGFTQALATGVRAGTSDLVLRLGARGAIEGTVIAFESAEPVIEFHVAALRPFDFAKLMDPSTFEPIRHARVLSAKGRYRLEDLGAGEYDVTVVAAGLARTTQKVTVEAGETVKPVNFFLRPEAILAGVVTERGTGKPVANARITTRQGIAAMQPDPLASAAEAQTDALGRFELHALAPGRYTLSATAQGLAPASAGPFDVEEGARRDDVTLVLAKGAAVFGRVLDAAAGPIAGAMINATRTGSVTPQMTVTDSEGNYRIDGLAAGSYQITKLSALALGSPDATADILKGMQTKTAKLAEGEELHLDFTDRKEGRIVVEGKVTIDGKPKANVLLHFAPEAPKTDSADDPAAAEQFHMATTDSEGHYSVDTLRAGAWTVTVQSIADLSSSVRQTFDLELDQAAQQFHDFALSRTGIEGTVRRRSDGKPIAGARISVDTIDSNVKLDAFAKRAGSRRTGELFADGEGRFHMSGMQAGRYRVSAGGLSLLNLGGGNFARAPAREITLSEGELLRGIDFELGEGGSIQGTVVAAGIGCEGASLFFLKDGGDTVDMDPFSTTFTDGAGGYLADGLEGGTYTVAAKVAGFAPAWRRGVDVRVGETVTIDLSLTEGTPFVHRVVDAEGNDVTKQSAIRVLTADGLDLTQLRSLSDFMSLAMGSDPKDLTRLGHGTYTVEIRHGDAVKRVTIDHGGSGAEHVITLD